MSEKYQIYNNIQSCPRFDHFVVDLLQHNDGVFFGELHDHPELRQAVVKLLPYFKANGVETVSLELPQNLIDEMKDISDTAEFQKRWPRAGEQIMGCFDVVKSAQKLGIHVLGHEVRWPTILEKALQSQQQDEFVVSETRSWWAGSEKGMKERDDFAASHIRTNVKGKFLVIGGWGHSGNYTKADMDDYERETDYGYTKSHDTSNKYQGLDFKLGIPSVDYRKAYPADPLGKVSKTNGKFSTYEVALPEGGLGCFYPTSNPSKLPHVPGKSR